ncbi:hypothetical protein KSF_066800 [Reticulibacter mediterranei]|uniref:Resolvase/invertase-type recombinase catalytic domain-containing protein n=1 Tax=Reticulibacter mediterranei TaxID=2778369 RepID=A0A8J3N6Z5_9CHLR|nr:hypothetical protein [Reticulibacter mediterranei]GHO96632.1 hypothetical protein KSF_066800 [Reticulibacter mediterranei]
MKIGHVRVSKQGQNEALQIDALGRSRKLKINGKVALARRMFDAQSHSIYEICTALGISRPTL